MNLFFIVFIASCFASLSNFFFRKNSDHSSSPHRYMCVQYFFSLIVAVICGNFTGASINFMMFAIGMIVGGCNVILMILMSLALKKGPTGPIFAFQNASAMFPGLLLFVGFGPHYGFDVTYLQIFGICMVMLGLYGFAKNTSQSAEKGSSFIQWFPYALGCFFIQIIALTIIQWRSLLFLDHSEHLLIPTTISAQADVWFLPGFFVSALILQVFLLLFEKKKKNISLVNRPVKEGIFGLCGGVANGFSSLLLTLATTQALPMEQVMLFPCFAVFVILLCSLWARFIYKEKFDFLSNLVCSIGIMMGKLS